MEILQGFFICQMAMNKCKGLAINTYPDDTLRFYCCKAALLLGILVVFCLHSRDMQQALCDDSIVNKPLDR
jgi:hypothetical protein